MTKNRRAMLTKVFDQDECRELFEAAKISSAVSTVLRVQEFPVAAAAVAEQCGYGDLR
jgi:hypothetical protein